MGITFLCSPEVRNSSMAELAGSAALAEFTEALTFSSSHQEQCHLSQPSGGQVTP